MSVQRKGAVEWLVMLLPAIVVGVGLVASYVSLQKDVSASCDKFRSDISRIESTGTKLSMDNKEKVVRLEEKFTAIDHRLERMEKSQEALIVGQQQLIRLLEKAGNSP